MLRFLMDFPRTWDSIVLCFLFMIYLKFKIIFIFNAVRNFPVPVCSARPLFVRFNLLPVFSILLLESYKFVRKFPKYFVNTRDVHDHDTRGRINNEIYVLPQTLEFSQIILILMWHVLIDCLFP